MSEELISVRVSEHDLLQLIREKAWHIGELGANPTVSVKSNIASALLDLNYYVNALPDDPPAPKSITPSQPSLYSSLYPSLHGVAL